MILNVILTDLSLSRLWNFVDNVEVHFLWDDHFLDRILWDILPQLFWKKVSFNLFKAVLNPLEVHSQLQLPHFFVTHSTFCLLANK